MMLGCYWWRAPGSANIPRTEEDPEEFKGDSYSEGSLEEGKDEVEVDKSSLDAEPALHRGHDERK